MRVSPKKISLPQCRESRDRPDPVDGQEEEPGGRLADEVNVQVSRKRGRRGEPEMDHRVGNEVAFDMNHFLFRFRICSAVSVVRSERSGQLVHGSGYQGLFAGSLNKMERFKASTKRSILINLY